MNEEEIFETYCEIITKLTDLKTELYDLGREDTDEIAYKINNIEELVLYLKYNDQRVK